METQKGSDTSHMIEEIIKDIREIKRKKPDKKFITREAAKQGLSKASVTSLLRDMVSTGCLSIRNGSYFSGKQGSGISDQGTGDTDEEDVNERLVGMETSSPVFDTLLNSTQTTTSHQAESPAPKFQSQPNLPDISIFQTVGQLATSLTELNKLLAKERETNRNLQEENFKFRIQLGLMKTKTAENNGNNQMVRKEQSDNTENNDEAKSMKLPIVYEDISVEKIEQVHKRKNKKRKNNKRKREQQKNTSGTSSNPNSKEDSETEASSNPKSNESNAPEKLSNSKCKENNSSSCLSPAEANLVASNSKTVDSTYEVVSTPKATAKEGITSCNSANENQQNGNQRGADAKRSQNGATAATAKKADKRRSGVILGDSMVKHVYGWELKEKCGDNFNVYVKSFPRATTKDMYSYSQPSIDRKPDVAILHVGTNDLVTRRGEEMKSEDEIAQGIVDLADHIRSHDIEVVVSGVIARGEKYLDKKREKVNSIPEDLCSEKKLTFIDHPNIEATKHLNRSKLHLNSLGDTILTNNLLSSLRF